MTDRFDLEQDIFKSWHVIDDIDLLCERLVNEEELSKDEIVAFLISLKTIYQPLPSSRQNISLKTL